MVNKRTVTATVLFVLLVATVLSAVPLVSAQEPEPNVLSVYPYTYFPGIWPDPPDQMPYLAGYDAGAKDTTTKVAITVSFPDTSLSVIPAGNYIAGGMFLQGQGGTAMVDYGFMASLSLDRYGTLQYNMAFWKTHEPKLEGWPWEWIGAYCDLLWEKAEVLDGVDRSEPVTLIMQWYQGYIEWLYIIDGTTYSVASCNAVELAPTIIERFYTGVYHEDVPFGLYPGDCYYYQFGIYSNPYVGIQDSGWKVRLEDPLYYDDSQNLWKCISKAKSITGFTSYLDHWYRWGGLIYYARGRYYENGLGEGYTIEFDWSPDSSEWLIDDHELLWDNPSCVCVLAEDQYGNLLKNGDVYIDGQWTGFTGSSLDLVGYHSIHINEFWEPGMTGYRYGFTEWEDGSTNPERYKWVYGLECMTPRFFKKWCPGDLDGSGVVDYDDINILSAAYGSVRGDSRWDSRADAVYDGYIDIEDAMQISMNFGKDYRPVGRWLFSEESGSTVGDSSLYGNTGTLYGGAQWTQWGKGDYALSFDGVNDYVYAPDSPSLNPKGITITLWVRQLSRNPYDWTYLLSKNCWGSSWGSYHLISEDRWDTNRIGFTVRVGGSDYRLWTENAIGNYWSFLAFTYDESTGTQRTYFNGKMDTEHPHPPGPIDIVEGPLRIIGAKSSYLNFKGIIDEVCIYDRALPAEEIYQMAHEVANGGFETGDSLGWVTGGSGDHVVTSEDSHSGSYSMLIGYKSGVDEANVWDWCYQTIAIPATATDAEFSFYYHMFTEDYEPYDWFEVYVRDSLGNNLEQVFYKAGTPGGGFQEFGWEQVTCDLSAYAGQTIQLNFAVANWRDQHFRTWCYIDDVYCTV